MPDPKPYHPGSYAYATLIAAQDVERTAERIRLSFETDAPKVDQVDLVRCRVLPECERLEHQAAALREIARKQYRDEWPRHTAVPAEAAYIDVDVDGQSIRMSRSEAARCDPDYPPIDPDEEPRRP